MLKRTQVVMLPTNEKANTFDSYKKGDLYLKSTTLGSVLDIAKRDLDCEDIEHIRFFNDCSVIGQHLYILSDEEIKEGDWYYTPIKRIIEQCVKKILVIKDVKNDIQQLKIIATTDKSLFTEIENQCDGCKANLPFKGNSNIHIDGQSMGMACSKRRYRDYLPQPSLGFLNEYVAYYNAGTPIKEIMVEYEADLSNTPYTSTKMNNALKALKESSNIGCKLKVNPKDNTITIRKVKDSWSREELHEIIANYDYDKGVIDWEKLIPALCKELDYPLNNNWINKNF